ncbi:MAG: hypothetical protein IT426_07195 [Pirellulales bacterium]|nr:hypothetical protein [Pirellulales bacterium]
MNANEAGKILRAGDFFRRAGAGILALFALFPVLLALPGCSGCTKDPATLQKELEKEEAERKKKEAEKPKPDFETRGLSTQPSTRQSLANGCKPGHWTSAALLDAKANNFDFLGDMDIRVDDGQSHLLPLLAMPYELATTRQVALPKGQSKSFDSVLFVPQNAQKANADCKLNARGGGRTAIPASLILSRMPSYQYHFVVLARIPEQYLYIDPVRGSFFSIRPYLKQDLDSSFAPYYRVSFVSGEKRPALPAHAMLWTSIAVVLWDDASPTAFDVEQQHALLDWLHYGGQIIVSGPDTLDTLKGSFLEPYLPAAATGVREIAAADLAEINAFSGNSARKLTPVKPWTGVKLEKHPQAGYVPNSGELLVERRVGRGRILVSAFRLTGRDFTTWPGVDEFYSAYLLRHAPRKFIETDEADQIQAVWSEGKARDWDAAEISRLRYFARDEGIQFHDYAPDYPQSRPPPDYSGGYPMLPADSPPDLADLANFSTPAGPGVAAWNDFSPAARLARDALGEAARIEVPKRSFVVVVLVLYLAFLVPFNWCLFRTLGRVEWAWAAAPVIAIACTAAVIKMAQLDIGFVRSRNEIGVLEIQPDYPRAHLTRYNALYTSLATPYDFTFADPGAAALPFPSVKEPGDFTMVMGQERRSLRYVQGEEAVLQGVPVSSNTTALMHSEEVFDLGGKISLAPSAPGGPQLDNQTKIKLQGVGLIKKESSGNLQTAWIRTLEPGKARSIDWVRRSGATVGGRLWAEFREDAPLTSANAKFGDLNIRKLLDFAENSDELRPGEVKMVAWTEDDLPGLTISPTSAQSRRATLVLAHLAYAPEASPRPDENDPDHPRKVKGLGM